MGRAWIGWAVIVWTAACGAPPRQDPFAPRVVNELGAWPIRRDGNTIGRLRHVEIADATGPIRRYYVDNANGKWLGYIDAQGRLYRYLPFETEEAFDGMYPMREALARLFAVDGGIEIVDAEVRPAEADARNEK